MQQTLEHSFKCKEITCIELTNSYVDWEYGNKNLKQIFIDKFVNRF